MNLLLESQADFDEHVAKRQKQDGINDNPDSVPDRFPCLLIDDHYGKNSGGWWRWFMEFLYPEDLEDVMRAAGYTLIKPPHPEDRAMLSETAETSPQPHCTACGGSGMAQVGYSSRPLPGEICERCGGGESSQTANDPNGVNMAIKSQATSLAAIPVHWPRCRCGYAAEQMEPCGDCGHCAYCPQCGGCNYCLFDAWLEDREPKEVSQGEEAITRIVRYWEKLIAACMKAGKRIADIPEPSHRRDEAAYLLEGRKGRIPRPFPK